MLAFISFLLVCIGSLNWFSIGILQYDFVAGIFGSQSNIFSRLIYTLVGIASIVVIINMIKNKGKFVVSFKKANKEYNKYMEEKKEEEKEKLATQMEASKDISLNHHEHSEHCPHCHEEALRDNQRENIENENSQRRE